VALAVAVVLAVAADVGAPASVPQPLWKAVYQYYPNQTTVPGLLKVVSSTRPRPQPLMRTPHGWKGTDTDPVWSPDGDFVAFYRCVPGCNRESLDVVQSDGQSLRRLLGGLEGNEPLAWSPDGQRLAVLRASNTLSILDLAGGTVRRLTQLPAGGRVAFILDEDVEWSADGRKLLCACGHGIYTVNANGAGKRLLLRVPGGGGGASWSPDGAWIAYKSNCTPFVQEVYCDVSVMHADGSHRRVLVRHTRSHGSMAEAPIWLPRSEEVLVAETGSEPFRVIAANARTGVARVILKQWGDELFTSADGATIGCYCAPTFTGCACRLLLMRPDGRGRRRYELPFNTYGSTENDLWLR
jgi:Tol biopolymer transport system component